VSRHASHKAACVLILDKRQAYADMATAGGRAGKVLRDFIQMDVAVIDFEEELHGALQPGVWAHSLCQP
jgi:hypothetical protein